MLAMICFLIMSKYLEQYFILIIQMGNQCCTQDKQNNEVMFSQSSLKANNIDMILIENQQLQQNLVKNVSAAPSVSVGVKVNKRPKLMRAVERTRYRQLLNQPLLRPKHSGINLPIYYLRKYKAFYDGQWRNGQPSGMGKLYFQNGAYYEGPFINGEITADDGFYIFPDGSYKRGQVTHGKMEGFGVFVNKDSTFRYEGNWLNDQPHGKGVEKYPDGSTYQGQFLYGQKHDDNGTYRWNNGKIYTGQFRNGYMEGNGKLFMPHGKGEYVGQFSRNLMVGHGTLKTQTGTYQGPFQNGLMHGVGIFKWYDNKIYEGEFSKGQLHGIGTLYFPNGQKVEGTWHYGQNLLVKSFKVGSSYISL